MYKPDTIVIKHSQVCSYRYLDVHIDNSLNWRTHVQRLCSKLQQHLHFLRRLRAFGEEQRIMLLFHEAVLESVIRYGL